MLERDYQTHVLRRLRGMFPGCVILRNDAGYMQGIPDWSLFWGRQWAMLEIKKDKKARVQPNQPHYVEVLNEMSFAAFIYPETEEEVLDALQRAFKLDRDTRISESQ